MMRTLWRRAIVVVPPPLDMALVQPIRERFDPMVSLMPCHITLVFPFESDLSAEHLRAHVELATEGVTPFAITLTGITGSESEYLFLEVERGRARIIGLHDRLYSEPLKAHLSRTHTFTPHVTVGRLRNHAAFEAALAAVAQNEIQIQTVARSVAVYRMAEDQWLREFEVG